MRKALFIALVFAFAAAAYASVSLGAAAQPKLTGPVKKLQYLVGTWSCTTKVAADPMAKMPASVHKGTITFSVEPSNTVGYYLISDEYSTGGYIGWMASKKMWYSASADNFGGVTAETGADDAGSASTMIGTTLFQGQSMISRDTITKTSNTKYRDLYEIQKGGSWSMGADSSCTKTSDKQYVMPTPGAPWAVKPIGSAPIAAGVAR